MICSSRWLSGAALAASFTAISLAGPNTYQLDESFESGSLAQPPWRVELGDFALGNVTVESSIVRSGKHALSLVNNYTDPLKTRIRTEMVAETAGVVKWGQEYWVGFSLYLKDWEKSPLPEMVHQFHGYPHAYDWAHRSARNLTGLYIKDGEMMLEVITKPKEGAASGGAGADPVWKAPVESNVWQDWVFHMRPSLGADGLMEVWRNGQQIYVQHGPNVDALDESGREAIPAHYLKVGVYNWPWMKAKPPVTRREVIYDNIRIGHVEGGYTGGFAGITPKEPLPAAKPVPATASAPVPATAPVPAVTEPAASTAPAAETKAAK